ncbi:MAG: hypothetical protein A2X48_20910 [Lentisphaerae bacterium GWF2_49_21]|nr:MAG: hypothetical protein A2X48_20910 [Lentisphaerae bacterium GWF2_49_21]
MTFSHRLRRIADSKRFNFFIVGLIVLTSIFIGMDTYPSVKERIGGFLELADKIILGIFVLEQLIRIGAEGNKPWRYFLDPWNVFDFIIITICLLPLGQSSVAVVRLVRILRVLRLLKTIPRLRMLVQGMVKSLSSIFYVAILLIVHFYLFSVLGVSFFHNSDPGHFADLQTAFMSLFQVLTLENWPDVMAPSKAVFPVGAQIYFLLYIIIGTMIILNLFVGVIVGSMAEANEEMEKEIKEMQKIRKLQQEGVKSKNELLMNHIENVEKELLSLKDQLAIIIKHEEQQGK